MSAKISNSFEKIFKSTCKMQDFLELFQKMVWWKWLERVEISKKLLSQQMMPKPCIFKGSYLTNGSSEPNDRVIEFSERVKQDFSEYLNIFLSKLWLIFCCYSTIYKKWTIFDILMTITPGVDITK